MPRIHKRETTKQIDLISSGFWNSTIACGDGITSKMRLIYLTNFQCIQYAVMRMCVQSGENVIGHLRQTLFFVSFCYHQKWITSRKYTCTDAELRGLYCFCCVCVCVCFCIFCYSLAKLVSTLLVCLPFFGSQLFIPASFRSHQLFFWWNHQLDGNVAKEKEVRTMQKMRTMEKSGREFKRENHGKNVGNEKESENWPAFLMLVVPFDNDDDYGKTLWNVSWLSSPSVSVSFFLCDCVIFGRLHSTHIRCNCITAQPKIAGEIAPHSNGSTSSGDDEMISAHKETELMDRRLLLTYPISLALSLTLSFRMFQLIQFVLKFTFKPNS